MKKKRIEEIPALLWPAIQGSITDVWKHCISKHCKVCRRGDKHPATILTYWDGKKHYGMYVPKALVKKLKQALRNGRKLEKLMKKMGPYLIREYRMKRKAKK